MFGTHDAARKPLVEESFGDADPPRDPWLSTPSLRGDSQCRTALAYHFTNRIDDHDDICRVVQLYIDGTANAEVSKLKEAFHDDARMFGGFLGSRYDAPIAELFRQSESMPAE